MSKLTVSLGIILSFSHVGMALEKSLKVTHIVNRSDVIWGFDFTPNGDIIFTEKNGSMALFNLTDKKVVVLEDVPKVWSSGQGGMLDVRVHPNFKNNKLIFFTYSKNTPGGAATALGSATLEDKKLLNVKLVFLSNCSSKSGQHFGSRIEFANEGNLYISHGDRGQRELAQDVTSHCGKILRLKENGSPATGNPFQDKGEDAKYVWSYGHRNPQGLELKPGTKELWSVEMGPRGGDELNEILPGRNYGWPEATHGREYSGGFIGPTSKPKMESPIAFWVPSISPSGMHFFRSKKISKWNGDLFLANLSGQHVRRLEMKNKKVTKQEKIFENRGQRFRTLRTGPDGFLYYSTDDGVIGRIESK